MLRGVMHTTGHAYPTPSLTYASSEPCSSHVAAEVCSAHWVHTPRVIISKAAAHMLLEMCLLFPQNSPRYSVWPWLLLCLFFFPLHFCKTNARTVIRLLSLLYFWWFEEIELVFLVGSVFFSSAQLIPMMHFLTSPVWQRTLKRTPELQEFF